MAQSGNYRTAVDEQVAKLIKARRKALKLSSIRLARGIGVSHQMIFKFENPAISRITSGRLAQIGAELGVPITYFFNAKVRKKYG